jgi:hypothetical protein
VLQCCTFVLSAISVIQFPTKQCAAHRGISCLYKSSMMEVELGCNLLSWDYLWQFWRFWSFSWRFWLVLKNQCRWERMWALCGYYSWSNTYIGVVHGKDWVKTDTPKKKEMCYIEIGLCGQNLDTILGSLVDTSGRAYVITQREQESSLWPL